MANFIINEQYESEILMLLNTFSIKAIGTVLKRCSKNIHLYQYLVDKYPHLNGKSTTEYLYWLVHDLHEYPKCKKCGKPVVNLVNFNHGYHDFCSLKCSTSSDEVHQKQKQTSLAHYGVEYHFQSDVVKAKVKKTCLEHFGVEYAFQSKQVKDKIKETSLERYGTDHPFKNENVQDRYKKTMVERYGHEYIRQCPEIVKKCEDTCMSNYGVSNPMQSQEVINRNQETCVEKYGVKNVTLVPEIRQKQIDTCIERYGCEHVSSRYYYNNIWFDSKPEVAYYIWLTDHHIKFEYHSDIFIEYIDFNGTVRKYYPDFLLVDENQLVEIKGAHFFCRGDNIMINPYNGISEQKKLECMLEHNVKILRDDKNEVLSYLKYVNDTYGKHYIDSFKIQNRFNKESDEE